MSEPLPGPERRGAPPMALGAGLIVVLAVLVGVLVVAGDDGQHVATRTYTAPNGPPSSSTTPPAFVEPERSGPISIEPGARPRATLALFGGGDPERSDDDEVVLVTFEGTELGRGSLAGWSTNNPDRGVDLENMAGAVVLHEAPVGDKPVPGCVAVHRAGGVQAAVCGPEPETDEIRVRGADGMSRVLTGPVGAGHWRWAVPSPDGRWLLAQWSGECEVPVAYIVDARDGTIRPVVGAGAESMGVGWAPDGRAVVGLWPGYCGEAPKQPGMYLVDPVRGTRSLIHHYFLGALVKP